MEGQVVIKGGFVPCDFATSSWIRNIFCSKAAALAVDAAAAFSFSWFLDWGEILPPDVQKSALPPDQPLFTSVSPSNWLAAKSDRKIDYFCPKLPLCRLSASIKIIFCFWLLFPPLSPLRKAGLVPPLEVQKPLPPRPKFGWSSSQLPTPRPPMVVTHANSSHFLFLLPNLVFILLIAQSLA